MQLISVLTALTAFKVAAALPSSVKGANNLVAREATLGSTLCVGYTRASYCQTFDNTAGLTPGQCIGLDDSMRGSISSIFPLPHSFCTYYMSENCEDTTGCGHYDATSPISDLTQVPPTNPNTKCEGNMDKKIRSFKCNPF